MKKVLSALLLTTALAAPGLAQANMSMKEHMAGNPHSGNPHASMGEAKGCDGCASSGTHGGMGMGGMGKMDDMIKMCLAHAEMMGFDNEQMAKLKPIHREMQRKQIQFKSELKLAEMDLSEIMEEKDFDLDKASNAVKRISEIKTRHHLEMLKRMREVRGIMTDAQFKGTGEEEGDDEE